MATHTVTASVDGQIIIPAPLLKKYTIHDGTRILVEDAGDHIVLRPITDEMVRQVRGSLKGKGAFDVLLAARAHDRERAPTDAPCTPPPRTARPRRRIHPTTPGTHRDRGMRTARPCAATHRERRPESGRARAAV